MGLWSGGWAHGLHRARARALRPARTAALVAALAAALAAAVPTAALAVPPVMVTAPLFTALETVAHRKSEEHKSGFLHSLTSEWSDCGLLMVFPSLGYSMVQIPIVVVG